MKEVRHGGEWPIYSNIFKRSWEQCTSHRSISGSWLSISIKETCFTFNNFRKFETGSAEKTSLLILIRLDAIIILERCNLSAVILSTSHILKKEAVKPCASIPRKEEEAVCVSGNFQWTVEFFFKDRQKSWSPFDQWLLRSWYIIVTTLYGTHFKQAVKHSPTSSRFSKMR